MAELTPTDEQQAVIEAARLGGNQMITAYAGCAKSSTLKMVATDLPPQPALYLVFNTRNKKEAEKNFPPHFKVMTLNGLGHTAWGRAIGRNPEVDAQKLGKLVTETFRRNSYRGREDSWDAVRQLVSRAMLQGLIPSTEQLNGLTPDTEEEWQAISDDLFLDATPQELGFARQILIESIRLGRGAGVPRPVISFDDQIYLSTMLGGVFPRYPLVMTDESQDLSMLNHVQVRRASADKLMVVGDPKQAIYAFRGADGSSMEKMRGLKGHWADLPLAITFRCPKAIVERQQAHAPGFRAWHTNPDGKIGAFQRPNDGQAWDGWTWQDFRKEMTELDSLSAAILCRNNAPLLSLAFKLLRGGVGVQVLGRDIGKGLITLSKKILPQDSTPVDIAIGLVHEWMKRETELAIANKKPHKVSGIEDRGESLIAVLEFSSCRDAGELRRNLEHLFSRDTGVVTLSTIHKAKGMEWDVGMHLDPWRIPSKFATQAAAQGDHIALQQERNLKYVCETRFRHTLINANLEDFHG